MPVGGGAAGGNIPPDLGLERCPSVGKRPARRRRGLDEYALRLIEDVLAGQSLAKPVGGSMTGLRFVTM